MDLSVYQQGFLPPHDPDTKLSGSVAILDEIGHDLPSLLQEERFRHYAKRLNIPYWPEDKSSVDHISQMRLYYLRLGFLASAYVNQIGQPPSQLLPANIAKPLCHIAQLLKRPPILSYDGYALYNWKRFDKTAPIALGNIDTLQNFVHLYDEHWFILVHIEIEALAANHIQAIAALPDDEKQLTEQQAQNCLRILIKTMQQQTSVIKRIPEKMDPALYYHTFRPYIRFFENVVYEGVDSQPINFRGETGAQSSNMPLLVSFLRIPHKASELLNHLADMRNYMPVEHRELIKSLSQKPDLRRYANKNDYNELLEAIAQFREVHYGWAQQYIQQHVKDPRGTGGTPYSQWLKQLIDETRAYMLD